MWISINEPKVYAFLKANGYVYTVRHYPVKEPFVRQVMVGRKLTGEKVKLMSMIKELPINLTERIMLLTAYSRGSGFDSPGDWEDAINRQHNMGRALWLLRVELVDKPQLENTELKSEI